jgi:hypothetical protein
VSARTAATSITPAEPARVPFACRAIDTDLAARREWRPPTVPWEAWREAGLAEIDLAQRR